MMVLLGSLDRPQLRMMGGLVVRMIADRLVGARLQDNQPISSAQNTAPRSASEMRSTQSPVGAELVSPVGLLGPGSPVGLLGLLPESSAELPVAV